MKRLALFGVLVIGALNIAVAAEGPAPGGPRPPRGPIEITVTNLGNNMYQLDGVSNSVVGIGTDGVIVVDSLLNNAEGIVTKIKGLTPLPVKYLISTHAHGDHTSGNEALAKLGATVISTQIAAAAMAQQVNGSGGRVIPALPPGGRPKETFTGTKTVMVGGLRAIATEVPRSHSPGGDAYIYFPDTNVLAMGDLHHSHEYPLLEAAGSFEGNLEAYDAVLKVVNDQTKIVPGHGPVTNKADMTKYVAMLRRVRGQVDDYIKQGKTADEVVAMKLLANDTSTYAGRPDNRDQFITSLYNAEKTGAGK